MLIETAAYPAGVFAYFGTTEYMSVGSEQFDLRLLLSGTRVHELTLTIVPLLSPDDTVDDVAEAMRSANHGSALVCANERLAGIVTERDVLRWVARGTAGSTPLQEVMTPHPQSLTRDETLWDAVRLLDRGGYRRLPVVDPDGRPRGVVDVKTIMRFVVDHMPTTVYNQAAQDLLTVRSREGA
jgi:CBS domain-containing protein